MDKKNTYYNDVKKLLITILFLNWAVALAKLIFGLISRSSSMTADGFHSFSDGASNIVGLVGITLASRPKDEGHPYGHKKYETFFSLGIAFLLGLVCVELFKEGLNRFRNPVLPEISIISFIIMGVTLCVNIFVMWYELREGRRLRSDILVSDALHTRADILTSISVMIAFIAIKMGYPVIDAVVTVLISLFIAFAAFEILKESSDILCDGAMIPEIKKIEDIVLRVPGVKSCHKIRTRGRVDDINLDLHVQVAADMHMDQAHKICFEIETVIKKDIPEVTDIVVHIEPIED